VHRAFFAGPASFHFEFSNPDDPRPEPAIGVLTLQGSTWRLTRLILPIEDLVPDGLARPEAKTGREPDPPLPLRQEGSALDLAAVPLFGIR
jgi:hypothetical protein